jgi:HKD family nuclease
MNKISQHLLPDLKLAFKSADEIWVAVALMTSHGLSFIRSSIPDQCKQNYILGTDLPTDPKVLEILYKDEFKELINTSIHVESSFYHPKVYIIKSENYYVAYVGSANCTKSGLESNIELSVIINNQDECSELINWYKKLEIRSKKLTEAFIDEYKTKYKSRKDRNREDEKVAKSLKSKLKEEAQVTLKKRADLINKLKEYRQESNYAQVKAGRHEVVRDVRKSLDYPNFMILDIEAFFKIGELGHILSLPKPTIKKEIEKFVKMLRYLTDESIDIVERVDETTSGNLVIRGVKEALISKVLTIHNPDLYYVHNGKSVSALKKYGFVLPKNLTKGEQYKATCRFLVEICKETGIEDLSILDYYLYELA